MFYTIYKITNLINNKFYIGKHETNNLEDDYMGSGKLIKKAIKKYGIENFTKEILEIYDSEEKMNLAEKILVLIDKEASYNLCAGGKGGWRKINFSRDYSDPKFIKKMSEICKNKDFTYLKDLHKSGKFNNLYFGHNSEIDAKLQSDEVKQKRKDSFKRIGHQQGEKNSNYGKPRSEETKQKIRESMLKRKTSS